MSKFGKKSTAYICYLVVNVWWYLSCLFGVLLPVVIAYEYFRDSHPDSILGISVPVTPSLVALNQPEKYDFISVEAANGMIDFGYILENSPTTYLLWGIFICLVLGLYLYGLYQTRSLLKASVNKAVFSDKNVKRIKVIAILVILIEPLEWIFHHFILSTLGDIVAQQTADISIQLPMLGSNLGFLLVGLLIYTLAAVFEKGHEMYQELKLTV